MRATDTIREKLFILRDEQYARFMRPLIPNIPPETVIGVRTPLLRGLAKEIKGTKGAEDFLRETPHEMFEENQLHAFLISEEKDLFVCLQKTEDFLPFIDNWATCDQLSPRVFARSAEALLPYIQKWICAEPVYTVRFGVKLLMQYFLDDRFRPEYLTWAADIRREEYYIQMGIAWYFATALAKQFAATIPFIEEDRLDPQVKKTAIRKACESRRVPEGHKKYLRSLQ